MVFARSASDSRVIHDLGGSFVPRTMRAAVKGAIGLDPMSDDFAATVAADRGQFVDRALEAIEDVRHACRDDLKRQIIVIATHFTGRHGHLPGTAAPDVAEPEPAATGTTRCAASLARGSKQGSTISCHP